MLLRWLAPLVLLAACEPAARRSKPAPLPVAAASQAETPKGFGYVEPAPEPRASEMPPEAPPVKLHRVKAPECGVEITTRATRLEHSERTATRDDRTSTVHTYRATDSLGSVSVSCMALSPKLSATEMLGVLAMKREEILTGATGLLGQRELKIGKHHATEIDVSFGDGVARWHVIPI